MVLNSILFIEVVPSYYEYERINTEVCPLFCGCLAVFGDHRDLYRSGDLLFIVPRSIRTFRQITSS